jgi:hypothetical protein
MSGFRKPENEPIIIRPKSGKWALVVLSFGLAAVLWTMLRACVLWEGAG